MYFDSIRCISLKDRVDRRKTANKLFKQLQWDVEYYIAERHQKGGVYGCFDSHIKVIQSAYNDGVENLLVLEDDIVLSRYFTQKQFNHITYFLKNSDWDVFYFGYAPVDLSDRYLSIFTAPKVSEHIIQFAPLCTHAYGINRKTMKKLLDGYSSYIDTKAYDNFLADLPLKSFASIPLLFDQKWSSESNNGSTGPLDTFCRKFQSLAETTEIFQHISWIRYRQKYLIYLLLLFLVVTYHRK